MNPARIAALRLGMGEAMTAFTVQINCGSGMQSIDTAYQYIREGKSDLILAGGTDALSWSPLLFRKRAVDWYARLFGARDVWHRIEALAEFRPSFLKPVVGREPGLTDPVVGARSIDHGARAGAVRDRAPAPALADPWRHRAVGAQRSLRRAGARLSRRLGGRHVLPRGARPCRRRRPH